MQTLSRQHRAWLAVLQVVLLLATLAAPAAASTSSQLLSEQKWLELLRDYEIVRGDERGNFNLDQPISRAEMAVIMVRAMGAENDAKLFKGLSPFNDTTGHWADAEISYVAIQKMVKGDGNGGFRPDDKITYAEALTLVLRLIGKEPTSGEWPFNVLLVAGDLGIAPPGVTGTNVKNEAIRGLVFQAMAKAVVDIKDAEGKNFLQKGLDTQAPVLSVSIPENTEDQTLKVSGTVTGATSVTVNGVDVALAKGSFSTEIALEYGENNVSVVATDWAGNQATHARMVTRPFPVAVLNIGGPQSVAPGSTQTYEIKALDNDGKPVSLNLVTVKVDGAIGSFDKQTGILTVANTPGVTGRITVSAGKLTDSVAVQIYGESQTASSLTIGSINGGQAVAYTKPMNVTVQVVDNQGQVVTTDYGRTISLKATGLQGVSVTPATAATVAGQATFTVKAPTMGTVTLEATSAGLTANAKTGVFGSTRRIRLTADPTELVAGGLNTSSRIKAEVLDEDGNPVANDTGEVIEVKLNTNAAFGMLYDETLSISRGLINSTSSGNDGLFSLTGFEGGSATITGTISNGPAMTVDSVTIRGTVPTVGAGTKLSAVASQVVSNAPNTTTFVIRLIDAAGNSIPTGNYAFQVSVETSNGEPKTNGIPEGMNVTLGDTSLIPVSDGKAEGSTDDSVDVVGRTINGSAIVKVYYEKPGKVTLTPIAMPANSKAYDTVGEEGAAASSTSLAVAGDSTLFVKPVAGVSLTVDSTIGTAQDVGAMPNSTGSSVTLNVTLLDDDGNWVPALQRHTVTLTRVTDGDSTQNTTPPSVTTANTSSGKASFTVKGHATAGMDKYKVTVGGTSLNDTVEIYTHAAKPATPEIAAVRGYSGSADDLLPGSLNEVAPDEDGLQIVVPPVSGETYVQAKVYVEGSNTPIYTSDAFDITNPEAMILVPKAKLPAGTKRYAVMVRNGFGDSAKSEYSAPVLNSTYNTSIVITSARLDAGVDDAAPKKLIITGAGFSNSTSTPDTIELSKITIDDPNTPAPAVTLVGADAQVSSSSTIVVTLSDAQVADLFDPAKFSGTDIRISAQSGWYVKFNGQTAAAVTNKRVTPGAAIDYATFDEANHRLHIFGQGFTTGEVVWSKLVLTYPGAASADTFTLDKMSPVRRSDTELVFTLNSTAMGKLTTIGDSISEPDYVVRVAQNGWFRDTTSALSPAAGDVEIFTKVSLRNVTYASGQITITGTNINLTTITPGQFTIHDRSTGQTLTLASNTPYVVDADSNTITLTLTPEDVAEFTNRSKYSGSDVYLRATESGWGVDDFGRQTAPIGNYDLVFPSL